MKRGRPGLCLAVYPGSSNPLQNKLQNRDSVRVPFLMAYALLKALGVLINAMFNADAPRQALAKAPALSAVALLELRGVLRGSTQHDEQFDVLWRGALLAHCHLTVSCLNEVARHRTVTQAQAHRVPARQ